MKCKICGNAISADSVYCQKCGKKVNEIGFSANDISNFLREKMESSNVTGIQEYCRDLIGKVGEQKFKTVEIHRSSLDGVDLSDLIYEKGDRLCIKCRNLEDYLKLTAALLINENDSIQSSLNDIKKSLHNDRVAKLNSAYTLYKRAVLTKDAVRRTKQLEEASNVCIMGISELKEEMLTHLELFEELPKSTVKKLFCSIRLQDAVGALKEMQEAFPWYCNGIRLLMSIDMQNKEPEKLNEIIGAERNSLKQMIASKGFQRLVEVDAENAETWDEYVNHLQVDMYCVEQFIDSDTITIKILEEKYG